MIIKTFYLLTYIQTTKNVAYHGRSVQKVNTDIAIRNQNYYTATGNHMPYGITHTSHPAEVTFTPLPQPKLVLDLATPKGCKAELTWWWLYPEIVYPQNRVTDLRNNQAVSWSGIELATESCNPTSPNH